MTAVPSIAERLASVLDSIAEAARQAGRSPDSVRLVAVTKHVDSAAVLEAAAAGQRDFGENYVQDGVRKIAEVDRGDLRWHMIGQLQSNKAAKAARAFDLIQSLGSAGAARAISRVGEETGEPRRVLLQIHLGGGSQRGGVAPGDAEGLAREVTALPGLILDGLMGVAPQDKAARPAFARLRTTLEALRGLGLPNAPLSELSAGMSQDYREAIMEGATMVRIGSAVFGPRDDNHTRRP